MEERFPNGLRRAMTRAGISQADLARRAGMRRQQVQKLYHGQRKMTLAWATLIAPILRCAVRDLMIPSAGKVDLAEYVPIFAHGKASNGEEPPLAILPQALSRMLPNVRVAHLEVVAVDDDTMERHFRRGDSVIVELGKSKPAQPGIYLVMIGGAVQFRFLAPSTAGTITVHADSPDIPDETVPASDLAVLGRARLRISPI